MEKKKEEEESFRFELVIIGWAAAWALARPPRFKNVIKVLTPLKWSDENGVKGRNDRTELSFHVVPSDFPSGVQSATNRAVLGTFGTN